MHRREVVMLAVWCEMTIDPAKREAYEAQSREYAEKSRSEAGCVVSSFTVHPTDPSKVTSFQIWDDRSSHAAHLATPEHEAIVAEMPDRGVLAFELRYLDVASCQYAAGTPSELVDRAKLNLDRAD
jgi:quinol monooxygenase YgiN